TCYLLNDLAVSRGLPYIYGGAVGTTGVSMAVLPCPGIAPAGAKPQAAARQVAWIAEQSTPCLRCVFPEAPPPGTTPTCDTVGVILPIVATIAALQTAEALKILTGQLDRLHGSLIQFDLWENSFTPIKLDGLRERSECRVCQQG